MREKNQSNSNLRKGEEKGGGKGQLQQQLKERKGEGEKMIRARTF
jgi:hypothetical protein